MTNYTNFTVKGQTVGLKFGLPAVRLITEQTERLGLGDKDGNYDERGLAYVLYAGYCNNNLIKELPNVLTAEDFIDEVEDAYVKRDMTLVYEAIEVWQTSTVVKGLADLGKKKMQESSLNQTQETSQSESQSTLTE